MNKANPLRAQFLYGLWQNNPGLVQLLGLCPLLAVTSTFVEAARRKRVDEEERDESRLERMETALGSIEARLERMEARLGSGGDSPPQD